MLGITKCIFNWIWPLLISKLIYSKTCCATSVTFSHSHTHTHIYVYIYIYITLSKIKEENPGMSLFIIDLTAKMTKMIDVLFKTSELFLKITSSFWEFVSLFSKYWCHVAHYAVILRKINPNVHVNVCFSQNSRKFPRTTRSVQT